jgi:hypothetical protein
LELVDSVTELFDCSGDFEARREWKVGFYLILTCYQEEIGKVERGSVDLDQDLLRLRFGALNVVDYQTTRVAPVVRANRLHVKGSPF